MSTDLLHDKFFGLKILTCFFSRGPHAFSEPETRSIRDFIMARQSSVKMYLTFHSYGQFFLYPWGYDRIYTEDRADLHRLAKLGAQATGVQYRFHI